MAILNKMTGFKVYKGTKDDFISSGKASANVDAIVFITGGSDASKSCIYAQGTYFANFAELIAAINYVKGITVGETSYNAAAGGGYIGFGANDPSTVSVDVQNGKITIGLTDTFVNKVNNTATALGNASDTAKSDGSAFARIAALAADLASLTGSSTGSIAEQIAAVKSAIEGTLGNNDAKTLAAINDELDAIDAKWADYVTNASLAAIEGSDNAGDKVKVTVASKGGKVTDVTVDESGLTGALNLKANAADVYTKTDAETMAQGKVDALANNAVKANTDAIAKLNGNYSVEGSVDKKIQDAINAFAGSANNDNVIDNITELLNYVNGVDGSKTLADAIAQIADNKGKIETLNGNATTAGSVAKAVADEVSRSEAAYAVKGTETVASNAASRAEQAYTLAGQKATAAEAKSQAVTAISEIAEVEKKDESKSVKVSVKTKAGSVSSVTVDDSGIKTYAETQAADALSSAKTYTDSIAGTKATESKPATGLRLEISEAQSAAQSYSDSLFMWEEL